jgi:uncharacterized membrane protein YuzA (DUF378 family)
MANATHNMIDRRLGSDRREQTIHLPRTLSVIDWIAITLVIIGGINWGLIGLIGFDLVTNLFGETQIARLVYVLVGLAAVWAIFTSTKLASNRRG